MVIDSLQTGQKFKITDVGEIPVDWEVVNVKDVCSSPEYGYTASAKKRPIGPKLLRITDIQFGKVNWSEVPYCECDDQNLKRYNLALGDILFARTGATTGKSFLIKDCPEAVFASYLIRLKTSGKISPEFLYSVFNSSIYWKQIKQFLGGSAQGGVNASLLSDIKIPLPVFNEQVSIAEILFCINDAIEKSDQIIEKTKQLKKGLMQQLLTGSIRLKGFEGKKWITKKLKDLANFQNGKAHERCISQDGQYTVVNSKFISTSGNVAKYSNQNLCPLFKNDIVMVMSDIPKGRALAKCYLIDEDNKFTLNQRICSIRAEKINNEFLYYRLNRNKHYLSFDDGVNQTNLKKEDVLNCPISFPESEDEQIQIAQTFKSIESEIELLENKSFYLDFLKKGLMQVLLTGKKRVKV